MIPLAEVIDDYILEREQDSPERFDYFMNLGISGIKRMHREATGAIKTTKVPLLPNQTAMIPQGAVKISNIYVLDCFGCVIALSYNSYIRKPLDQCGDFYGCDNYVPYAATIPTLPEDALHNYNGYNIGAYYGIGGGSPAGGYNIRDGVIQVSTGLGVTHLIIDYIGLPEKVGVDYMVHPYFEEFIKDWIDWKSVVRKSSTPLSVIADKEMRMEYSLLFAKMNTWGLTSDQLESAALKNFTPTPKF